MSIVERVKNSDNFIIFGAQVVAYGAYTAIKMLTGRTPLAFAVSDLQRYRLCNSATEAGIAMNPEMIESIPVKGYIDFGCETLIVVAVTELVQKEVVPMLRAHGYNNLILITQDVEHNLMSAYYTAIGKFSVANTQNMHDIATNQAPFLKSDLDIGLYEVKNHRDKLLLNHKSLDSGYEFSIQAGAALTDKRVAPILDNTGDNISDRNKKYCEMTAAYYVWKNTHHEWKGIEHYRRHLLVTPGIIETNPAADVFMPLPYICYPSELCQFRRFVSEDVLNALTFTLKNLHPAEYDDYMGILNGKYQYTYNLVCAREDVFDDYCRWFFEITEYMESMEDKYPEIKTTRALSYVAEVLTNIYYMHNSGKLNILHVAKEIFI